MASGRCYSSTEKKEEAHAVNDLRALSSFAGSISSESEELDVSEVQTRHGGSMPGSRV